MTINIIKKLFADGSIGTNNKTVRETWLKSTLEKIPKGLSILDAGAGELQYKKFCQHLKYTSQDFAKYDGRGNESALQPGSWDNSKLDIVSDIGSIPRPDKSFDTVMCVEVLEHIPYPNEAFKEFSRLLKSGGKLIITAPFCSLSHFTPYHFATGFNKYFYETVLKANGFKVLEIIPNGNYYEYIAQEIRRVPNIVSKYSNTKVSIFEKLSIKLMLRLLNKYNKKDIGSKELLCFGYHVLAQKI
ncbi:MAG: methyltransferase domain-containing protein [Candidatus Paceibacterota bacterium]